MKKLLMTLTLSLVVEIPLLAQPNVSTYSVRVGRSYQVIGPVGNTELDNHFNEIQLGPGNFLGFTAQGTTYSIPGTSPTDMSGPSQYLIGPGNFGAFDANGRWVNTALKGGSNILYFFHAEGTLPCAPTGFKSMGLATAPFSTPSNITSTGQILGCPTVNTVQQNEGDGQAISWHGYYWIYALDSNFKTLVANAIINADGSPGGWCNVSFTNPNGPFTCTNPIGGAATELPGYNSPSDPTGGLTGLGTGASVWMGQDQVTLLSLFNSLNLSTGQYQGMTASFASFPGVKFTVLQENVIPLDCQMWGQSNCQNWNRIGNGSSTNPPTELLAYPSVVSPTDGSNNWNNSFWLTYMYIQPNEGFNQKYLVMRNVSVTNNAINQVPQVGLELSRYYNSNTGAYWATTAMAPTGGGWNYQTNLGYIATVPPSNGEAVTPIYDCVWQNDRYLDVSNPTHTACGGATGTLRLLGWVFNTQNNDTNRHLIYRCYNSSTGYHYVSTSSTCDSYGIQEWPIGYVLTN